MKQILFNFFKNIVKSVQKLYAIISRHRQKKMWRKNLAKNTINQVLTKSEQTAALEFYKPYCNISTIAHNYYTEKTGIFCPDYIPDDMHYTHIDPYFNNWKSAKFIDNKCQYPALFKNVTHAENIIWRTNGLWFRDFSVPLSYEEINAVLAQHSEIFVKIATESLAGKGVFFISGQDLIASFWNQVAQIPADIVVQKPIVQHERLSHINGSSVNTIRSISLLTSQGVVIYSSILRMGIDGAKVDNASSGGITCGIDKNGCLKKYAYKMSGEKFLQHPNSNVSFEAYSIPSFDKIQKLIPTLHCQIPHFRLVSWDFAVREDGEPVLIEANLCYGEIDFHQINNGPLFGDDTRNILDEVFHAK